jgi:hypothetical protein
MALAAPAAAASPYAWLAQYEAAASIEQRIAPPSGFVRVPVAAASFGAWLRGLPLKKGRPEVRLYDGRLKRNQEAHWAVVDIDTGDKDLQQCADAVMRLRAEYLFASGQVDAIAFDFTSGDRAAFARWAEGFRPRIKGDHVSWSRSEAPAGGYASFRRYLDTVFTYAGSASLSKQLESAGDPEQITVGDVFIQGGFPGHAVTVVDVAAHPRTGAKVFLIAQSYMPAQEIHVLRNPARRDDPWYTTDFGATLETPEWTFHRGDLKRF